jgi:antitoxin CptB
LNPPPESTPEAIAGRTEARRVLWRCRRGMKELDVLLERFARERYDSASAEDKSAFARLLDLPDPEIADYVLGHATPAEPQLARLARLITSHQP